MLTSFFLQLLSLLCLSLAMHKHYYASFKVELSNSMKVGLRLLGVTLMVFSIGALISVNTSFTVSAVEWLVWLSVNIVLVALLHAKIAK
ncbi:DUF3325 family protein [Paraglaciecola sp. 2405UD69-4]|uniref:DUF3325 family protein n=1 Tax=Paraglaciecola sp. 2405UD69-4 TaxID=3391836 RepID=UPI0039C8DA6B